VTNPAIKTGQTNVPNLSRMLRSYGKTGDMGNNSLRYSVLRFRPEMAAIVEEGKTRETVFMD
jgi:hypothetical protein